MREPEEVTREKARVRARANGVVRRARNRTIIDEAKRYPCQRCDGSFPVVCMDFHHLDPTEKSFNIAQMLWQSPERIYDEIAKCVLLCANCHRIIESEEPIRSRCSLWYRILRAKKEEQEQ